MDVDTKFTTLMTNIETLLYEANITAVRKLKQNETFLNILQTDGIAATECFIKLLNETSHYQNVADIQCCEELFRIIVENVPDKLLLIITLLDPLHENTCCVRKFFILLYPIQLTLFQAPPSFRDHWVEWALTAVENYIGRMKLPSDHVIERNEKKMLSSDPYVEIVLECTRKCCSFYAAIVHSGLWSADNEYLTAFGFRILSGPIMHVYAEKFPEVMQLVETVVSLIDSHSYHISRLLAWLDESRMTSALYKTVTPPEAEVYTSSKLSEKVSAIQLALYYSIKTGQGQTFEVFPCIYERLYLFHKMLFLSVRLSKDDHNAVSRQGLKLAERFLNAVEDGCIPHQYLELRVHFDFVKSLSWISTHSYIFENRQLAFPLLKLYLNKFAPLASYLLYTHIFKATENSDVNGEIVSYFRHKLFLGFNANQLDEFHRGKYLVDLLRCFCHLEKAEKTDLLKHKSVILSTLHTFVLILGRDTKNETCVRDHFSIFEKQYFEVLKEAIRLTRNEFHAELSNLLSTDEGPPHPEGKFDLVVEGEVLPPPKTSEKVESLQTSLRVVDMIENALDMVYTYARK